MATGIDNGNPVAVAPAGLKTTVTPLFVLPLFVNH